MDVRTDRSGPEALRAELCIFTFLDPPPHEGISITMFIYQFFLTMLTILGFGAHIRQIYLLYLCTLKSFQSDPNHVKVYIFEKYASRAVQKYIVLYDINICEQNYK